MNDVDRYSKQDEFKKALITIGGILGLIILLTIQIALSIYISNQLQNADIDLKYTFYIFTGFVISVFVIFIAIYFYRGLIGEEGAKFVENLGNTVEKANEANNTLNNSVIPSFIRKSERPLNPPILNLLSNSIDQLDRNLERLRDYTKGAELINRNIVTLGDIGSQMLSNFFDDPVMREKDIDEIRFMGTGRGAFGLPNYSYKFSDYLKTFLITRGSNYKVFSRFKFIGAKRAHDQFCARVFAIHMILWLKHTYEKNLILLPQKVEFLIVYPYNDAVPALLSMGEYKTLIAIPIGYEDSEEVAKSLPIGIQIIGENQQHETSGISLKQTNHRFIEHFDELFTGKSKTGEIFRNDLVPEVWGLLKQENDIVFYVKDLNESVFNDAIREVSIRLNKEEKDQLISSFNKLSNISKNPDFGDRKIGLTDLETIYHLLLKAAELPKITLEPIMR